ncbi:MAG: glycosyltransferase [Pseudomonadota bacterium]|nr:glycosyltransferase [Pseudomonadota bacterium]
MLIFEESIEAIIVFPIFNKSVIEKEFALNGINPGCGGTQYVTIILAQLLSGENPSWKVVTLNDGTFVNDESSNVCQIHCKDIDSGLVQLNKEFKGVKVLVAPEVVLKNISNKKVSLREWKIVGWLHHPFHLSLELLLANCDAYVSCGSYQYESNKFFYKNHWQINNIFLLPPKTKKCTKAEEQYLNLIYLGALVPGKGFHLVAQQWKSIKSIAPKVKLHVVGGISTYGRDNETALIPTTQDYARTILEFIDEDDIRNGDVIFHGNIGKEKFSIIRNCYAAILNPTGESEAFPASPLECMSQGVPVIASSDFGMIDSMQYFPELSVKSADEITEKLRSILDDRELYLELSARSIAVAKWFSSQTEISLIRWNRLLSKVIGELDVGNSGPYLDVRKKKYRMVTRILWSVTRMFKKLVVNRRVH